MPSIIVRSTQQEQLLSRLFFSPDSKHTDGTLPRVFQVAKGGADGLGNGTYENPYLTIRRAIQESVDGRGDVILIGPGEYDETIDIGASGTASGPAGGYAKRNLAIIGTGNYHTGMTQIIGDGSTGQATIRVRSGYLRGFRLMNVELDTNGLTRPALHLITDDTAASPTATSDYYRFLIDNVAVRSDDPECFLLLEGATLGVVRNCHVQGPDFGIFLAGSANNWPNDIQFSDIDFMDCVTADIATGADAANTAVLATGSANLTNVQFYRMRHWDRGGTPVTNYVNFAGTMVNTHFFDCYAARDVADGTLLQLPVDVVWQGYSAAAAEFIIGA